MRIEILKDGQVVSTIIAASLEAAQDLFGPDACRVATEQSAAPADPRFITQLAFLTRFTDTEAIGIDLASIGATPQAAGMRRYLNKVNAAEYIDLDRADTRAGVQALETGGALAPGRALAILDAPVQPAERYRGR